MNILKFEFKNFISDKISMFLFIVFLFSPIAIHLSMNNAELLDYKIAVAVIDLDKSIESNKYIESLKQNEILDIIQLENNDKIDDLLKKSLIESSITIPKNYFKDVLNSKIQVNYLNYSTIAPSLLDIFAKDLMPFMAKQRLVNVTKKYISESFEIKALEKFEKANSDYDFNLYSKMLKIGKYEGLKVEYQAKIVELGKLLLGFFTSIISIIFSLSYAINLEVKNTYRILTIKDFYRKKYIIQRFFNYFKLVVLSTVSTISIVCNVGFKVNFAIPLILYTVLIPILFFEIFCFVYNLNISVHMSNLLNIGIILLSSIFGGAYFSIDLLPKAYHKILSFIPFYQLNSIYYSIINGLDIKKTAIYIITVIILVISFSNYKLNKINALR